MGRRVVLITGASTGLGLAIAHRFMRGDDHLVLTARKSSLARFEALGITENERLWIRQLDVTSPVDREALVSEIDRTFGAVGVLINNAGISYRSAIEHVTNEERHHQMDVNYDGPLALCRLVLPSMREQRSGRIIQISSGAGLMGMPTMGIYAASKFALEGATESLYYEVRPFGIKVSLVLPGFINSEGIEHVLLSGESERAIRDPKNAYHPQYRDMGAFIGKLMRLTPATPEKIARTVYRISNQRFPKLRVAGTWDTKLLWVIRRFLPQRLYHEVLYRSLPGVRHWGPKLP